MKTLEQLRKERGLTLQEMADALGYSSKSGYAMLEKRDPRNLTVKKLELIANEFNLTLVELQNFLRC